MVLAALASPGRAEPARGAAALRARARAILAEARFQPAAAARAAPEPAAESGPPERRAARGPEPGFSLPAEPLSLAAGVLRLALYALGAAAVVLGLMWALGPLLSRRRRRQPPEEAAAPPAAAAREEPLADPSALAGEGRYAEALHALLLAAIRRLAARSPQPPAPSRTSRELARLLPLAPEARGAFAELVAAVERSLFGGAAVGREEFERSRERYEAAVGREA